MPPTVPRCRFPDCTSEGRSRGVCSRDYSRVGTLIKCGHLPESAWDEGQEATWAAAWERRSAEVHAAQSERRAAANVARKGAGARPEAAPAATLHPLARAVLDSLAGIDEDCLSDVYNFSRADAVADGELLDSALFEWIDAGRPITADGPGGEHLRPNAVQAVRELRELCEKAENAESDARANLDAVAAALTQAGVGPCDTHADGVRRLARERNQWRTELAEARQDLADADRAALAGHNARAEMSLSRRDRLHLEESIDGLRSMLADERPSLWAPARALLRQMEIALGIACEEVQS